MTASTPGGKGSSPRPFSVSNEEYARRWDEIFRKEPKIHESMNKCPLCGMELSAVMSYSCPKFNCPTGLGSSVSMS